MLRVVPFGVAGYLSLTKWDGLADPEFVGLANYRRALDDPALGGAVQNSIKLVLALPLWIAAAFLVAALVHERAPIARLSRFSLMIPVIVSPAILGLYFSLVLGRTGPMNRLLGLVGLESLRQEWLVNPRTAFGTFAVIFLWTSLGVNSLFYSAALSGLDPELLDAAALDGAGLVSRYRHVVVPHVAPITGVIAVFTVITFMTGTFPLLFTLTGGGPGRVTTTVDLLIYQAAFLDGRFGYSCALAMLTLAVIIALLFLHRIGTHLTRAVRRR